MEKDVLKWIMALASLLPMAAAAEPLPRPASFALCTACHKTAAGEKSIIGPNLWAVGGRKAGARPDFRYSPAMAKSKISWTRQDLAAFLAAPQAKVPGTKMAFAGQRDPKKVKELVDYLWSLR